MATRHRIPPFRSSWSHTEFVQHFIRHRRALLHQELEWFASQPSFDDVLFEAVHARDRRGKRLSHQRRLLRDVIPTAYKLLGTIRASLQSASTFDDLFALIDGALGSIPGSGDLYAYDTALRIGAYMRLYPTRVFLQTGALDGARKISTSYKSRSVPLAKFPEPYHSLAPFEMENLLCVAKSALHP